MASWRTRKEGTLAGEGAGELWRKRRNHRKWPFPPVVNASITASISAVYVERRRRRETTNGVELPTWARLRGIAEEEEVEGRHLKSPKQAGGWRCTVRARVGQEESWRVGDFKEAKLDYAQNCGEAKVDERTRSVATFSPRVSRVSPREINAHGNNCGCQRARNNA